MAELLKIAGWSTHFENNRTRELKKMDWVPVPTKQDGDGYTELVSHKNGAAHLGAWMAIVQVAAKCDERGTLLRDARRPHDSQSLARISRLPKTVFDEAIPRLVAIGWLETEVFGLLAVRDTSQQGAGISQADAEKSQVACARDTTLQDSTGEDITRKGITHVSPEPQAAAVQAVLIFETVGDEKSWNLIQDHINRLKEAFPDLDVIAECRKARQWCHDNAANRKTPRGMGKFLFGWMSRAQNKKQGGSVDRDPRGTWAAAQEFLNGK